MFWIVVIGFHLACGFFTTNVAGAKDTTRGWTFKPGVYIFAGRAPDRTWRACYIGETSSFAKRTPDHELWFTAVGLGASDVHVSIESHPARRTEFKQKLIGKHHPPLNK